MLCASDHGYCTVRVSPIARRLKEYGSVKALVVGPRAQMSSDLHSLVNCISDRAAEVRWRGMLATDVIAAKGVIKTMIDPWGMSQRRVLGGPARHHAWGRESSVR